MANANYYAIIPADVRYDKTIPANAKLLYGEITALCNQEGYCWASNGYFAELYDVSETSISKWISALAKAGYIYIESNKEKGNARLIYLKEVLKKSSRGIEEKLKTPIEEKLKHNNTEINTTSNTTKNKEPFSFTLKTKKPFSSLSDEYKDNLEAKIKASGLPLDWTSFRDACIANGYKYQNFWLAYQNWAKKDFNKPKSGVSDRNNLNAKFAGMQDGEVEF